MSVIGLRFIRRCVELGRLFFTNHAAERMIEREISLYELKAALMEAESIEDEPDAQSYPSCLLLGWLETGDPLHIKCSRKPGTDRLRVVTVYEPDDNRWKSDYKSR